MVDTYEGDGVDELLENACPDCFVDEQIDEGFRDYVKRWRRWWTILSAVRTLSGTDPSTHQPIQREVPILPAPRTSTTDRRRQGSGQGADRADRYDAEIDRLLEDYLVEIDEGEDSGPCFDTFLWCMENTRRRRIPFGQSVCHACWDQCREGIWPYRVAGRVCPGPNRSKRRRRRKLRASTR